MKQKIFFVLIILIALSRGAFAGDLIGEKLTYEFGWQGYTAAKAEITVGEIDYYGTPCYEIEMNIRSLSKLEWIWKVRDKLTSYTRKSDLVPMRFYYLQREGKFALDTEILLDKPNNLLKSTRTQYKDDQIKHYRPKQVQLNGHMDPLGALLKMRKQDFKVGEKYEMRVFDGKREHVISYKVLTKETIDTKFGKQETFRIEPRIEKSSGDPDKTKVEKVQTVTLWIATSPDHTVYRIESKVWLGSVFAELVSK